MKYSNEIISNKREENHPDTSLPLNNQSVSKPLDSPRSKSRSLQSADDYYQELKSLRKISTGSEVLDNLLGGGWTPRLSHLLVAPQGIASSLFMKSCVSYFVSHQEYYRSAEFMYAIPKSTKVDIRDASHQSKDYSAQKNKYPDHDADNLGEAPRDERDTELSAPGKIAYVDGTNRFDPYSISKMAAAQRLPVRRILDDILISRAFSWNQITEIIEEKLSELAHIGMVVVTGITSMFLEEQDLTEFKKPFQDLKKMLQGFSKTIERHNPIIIMSTPRHPKSRVKPIGGNLLTHFANVIVRIKPHDRYIDFILEQHPFLENKSERLWIPLDQRQSGSHKRKNLRPPQEYKRLDFFM